MYEQEPQSAHGSHIPPDPSGIPEPHDILAAEEFGIGTRYDRFPSDPTGNRGPHDTLAAEEFPMPVPDESRAAAAAKKARREPWLPLGALVLLLSALVMIRRR